MASLTIIIVTLSSLLCIAYQAIPTKYLIEVYFIVDRTVVDRYISELHDSGVTGPKIESRAMKRLNADILYMVREMRKLFQTFKPLGLDIRVGIRKIEFIPQRLIRDKTKYLKALGTFSAWMGSTHPARDKGQDVTILWTGVQFDESRIVMTANSSKPTGYSTVWNVDAGVGAGGTICTRYYWAVGVVLYTMTYKTAWVTAHEIAHILGADHDNITQSVMYPFDHYGPNRWTFSMKSKQEIEATLNKLPNKGKNCLQNRHPLTKLKRGRITPELNNPDTVCRRAMRYAHSSECRVNTHPDGHICQHLMCKRKGRRGCTQEMASEGMICGPYKRCRYGKCVYHPDKKSARVRENCVFGDSLQHNCRDYVKQNGPLMCTVPANFQLCCQTCNDAIADMCKGEVFSFKKELYCGSLNTLGYEHLCYNPIVRRVCCEDCYVAYTGVPGCEFGDRSNLCEGVVKSNDCHIKENAETCCQSCSRAQGRKRSADIIGAIENFDNKSLEDHAFVVKESSTYRLPSLI